jgi:hypothetical protein
MLTVRETDADGVELWSIVVPDAVQAEGPEAVAAHIATHRPAVESPAPAIADASPDGDPS